MWLDNEVLVTDAIFEFCSPSSEGKWIQVTISFGIGVIIALMLKWLVRKTRNTFITRSGQALKTFFKILTPLMILLGTFSHFYEVSQNFGSLFNCAPFLPTQVTVYTVAKYMTFTVHIYFMVRAMTVWTVTSYVESINTFINVALFVQDIMALIMNQHLLAFQYLFLYNYYCPEVKALLARTANLLFPSYRIHFKLVIQLCTVIVLLGGCLRAAEEWETNEYFHPDFEGSVTPMRSSWAYSYWILITISTVGFGDLTPSTTAGQFVIIAAIAIFVIWFSDVVSNLHNHLHQRRPSLDHKSKFICVMGCRNESQLMNFLATFREKPQNIKVYIDSKDREFSATVRDLDMYVVEGYNKKESLISTVCPGHAKDTVFLLLDPALDADEADKCNMDLVRSVRGYRSESVLFVEMAKLENQKLLQSVTGWNNTGSDICVSRENLTAHMLALSAHSRLAPGTVGTTFGKQLFTENDIQHSYNFFRAVENSYTNSGNLLLGAAGEDGEILINPKQTKQNWPHILLATDNHPKDFPTRKLYHKHNRQRKTIQTRSIDSKVSVIETASEALIQAMKSHPITLTSHLEANVLIYESKIRPEDDPDDILEFLDAKHGIGDTRLVSIMEHGYEACRYGIDLCVCGTYQINSLLMCLLATAYHDHHLYKLWKELIEEDLLEVEEIEESCTYNDLFHQLISLQKVPLGVEANQLRDGENLRLPILNPVSTLQLQKGDSILYIRKTNILPQ